MPKKMPLRGQLANRDSMSVDGSNSDLFEELMADVTEEDKQEIREANAVAMEKFGYPKEAVELMRNPQPVPPKTDGETTS